MIDRTKQAIGKEAELTASQFLKTKGLLLLEQNYRCHWGEIDLIMRDRDVIVFIEVRSRSRTDFGSAVESVNKSKQLKLFKTATHFLQKMGWLYKVNSRFDIIAIHYARSGPRLELEWFKNAFSVPEGQT